MQEEIDMRAFRTVALMLGSLGLVAIVALPVRAADANSAPGTGEIAGGYFYVYASGSDGTGVPAGWFFSAGAQISDSFAVVGDVSGNHKSDSTTIGATTLTTSASIHTFLAGPRVTGRVGQLGFYGQFLVGAAMVSGGFTANGGGPSQAGNTSDMEFCFAPGAGVDISLGERAALRVGVSERLIRAITGTTTISPPPPTFYKEFQLQIGLVYRFGI